MKNVFGAYNTVLVSVLVLSLLMFAFEGALFTGKAISGTAPSEVVIEKYLSIALSPELSSGIDFGTVLELPAANISALENDGGSGGGSMYFIQVSMDSNTPVDFCVQGSGDLLTPALDAILLSNERYATSVVDNDAALSLASSDVFTTSYVKAISNISPGSSSYYRFWLSIDAAQAAGLYNNTVGFKGVVTGGSC